MTMTEGRERLGLSLCPFCGGPARFGKCGHGEQEGENDGAEYVECCDCGASTCLVFPLMDSAKQVLCDMWNRRTEPAMKAELAKEWCMNMGKIEARAAELHEGCRMPMEQACELAASEANPDWYARGQDWALADSLSGSLPLDWTAGDIARAYAAGAHAADQSARIAELVAVLARLCELNASERPMARVWAAAQALVDSYAGGALGPNARLTGRP